MSALFSHQRNELNAYAAQIKPALLIADREHALFAGDDFLNRLWMNIALCVLSCCVAITAHMPRRPSPTRRPILSPTPARRRSGVLSAFRRQYRHAKTDPAYA